jgi:DNA-binding CsgD family transcriptional regulator
VLDQPIVLLFTYRADEVNAGLSHWLVQLTRARLAHEFTLTHLSRQDVATMVRLIFALNRPVREEFLDEIYPLTEGNPFFVEEVLRTLVESKQLVYGEQGWGCNPQREWRVPSTLQAAVQQRVALLSGATQRTVMLAAVVGRSFDFSLLQRLTNLDEPMLVNQLKELIAAHLIVEESAERFAFRHALTRQAIYARLLVRERKTLHHTVAETLERAAVEAPDLAALAYHYGEAEMWDEVLHYAQRAGEQAQSCSVLPAAVEHFTHALQAARHLGVSPPPILYRRRGMALAALGKIAEARSDLEKVWQLVHISDAHQAQAEHPPKHRYWVDAPTIPEPFAAATPAGNEPLISSSTKQQDEALAACQQIIKAAHALAYDNDSGHAFDLRPLLWRVQVVQAKLHLNQGEHAEAEGALARARTQVEGVAAALPEVTLRQQFEQTAFAIMATVATHVKCVAPKENSAGLTRREHEVALCIAQGKSNRAIAETLVVSERTVESHVGRILGKLGFTSRSQVVAWVHEQKRPINQPF